MCQITKLMRLVFELLLDGNILCREYVSVLTNFSIPLCIFIIITTPRHIKHIYKNIYYIICNMYILQYSQTIRGMVIFMLLSFGIKF